MYDCMCIQYVNVFILQRAWRAYQRKWVSIIDTLASLYPSFYYTSPIYVCLTFIHPCRCINSKMDGWYLIVPSIHLYIQYPYTQSWFISIISLPVVLVVVSLFLAALSVSYIWLPVLAKEETTVCYIKNSILVLNIITGSTNQSDQFGQWFTWCQTCRHGGHAAHLAEWFE